MKKNIKEILVSILGYLSLSFLKILIILILIFSDDNFYYLSKQKNINYGDLAMKLFCINVIPLILYPLICSYFIYKYLNSFIKTLIVILVSILIYYLIDFIQLTFFIENHRYKVYASITLVVILIIWISLLLQRYGSRKVSE